MDINKLSYAAGFPKKGEAGQTSEWAHKQPVINKTKCLAYKNKKQICQICWIYCPEACISKGSPPKINKTYCKGCGVCAEECPGNAIDF